MRRFGFVLEILYGLMFLVVLVIGWTGVWSLVIPGFR